MSIEGISPQCIAMVEAKKGKHLATAPGFI